jgi:transcriptional regulator with XRE-family HTH domain
MLTTKIIGNKITEARKRLNISQAQLAQQLFISSQAVGKWERGESMPDIITLNRLAEILGIDLNYFSEKFQSVAAEITPFVSSVEQSAEMVSSDATQLPSGKAGKKLNWDMSRGNWAGADFSGLKNLHDKFSSSNMQLCKFIGSDFSIRLAVINR